jgi:tetratricopeptide (TPR) repeat protein
MSEPRVVVPIAEAKERRHQRRARENHRGLMDALEGLINEPDIHDNFTFAGNLGLIEGRHDQAIEAYSHALAFAPDHLPALTGRGRALEAIEELDLALADFDRALAHSPGDAKLHYHRGYCLSRLTHARWERGLDESESEEKRRGRCNAALASLERAVELGLHTEDVYFELVCVREQMGDEEAYVATLDRAIEAAPNEVLIRAVRYDRRVRRGDPAAAADLARLRELGFEPSFTG